MKAGIIGLCTKIEVKCLVIESKSVTDHRIMGMIINPVFETLMKDRIEWRTGLIIII